MPLHPLLLLTLFVFAGTLCLTLALVPLFARLATARGLVDQPNGRKVHTTPIPRIGGPPYSSPSTSPWGWPR